MGGRVVLRSTVAALAVVALGVGCSNGDDEASGSSTGERSDESSSAEFCDIVERLESGDDPIDTEADPDAAIARLQELQEAAPEELSDDIGQLVGVLEELESAGSESPEAVARLLELMASEDFEATQERIATYTEEECGIEPASLSQSPDVTAPSAEDDPAGAGDEGGPDEGAAPAPPSSQPPGSTPAPGTPTTQVDQDPNEVSLEDIDSIELVNSANTWAAKITSKVVSGDEVEVGSGRRPLTAEEGLAACRSFYAELVRQNPNVVVVVTNLDGPVASSAGGQCRNV